MRELGFALGGHVNWRLEQYLETVDLEAVNKVVVKREALDLEGCRLERSCDISCDSFSWLT